MLAVILLTLFSAFVTLVVKWYLNVRYYEKYLKDIPGPRGLPLIGNALQFGSSIEILPKTLELCQTYKTNFKTYIGGQANLMIIEPKDVEFLLNSSTILKKSTPYSFLHNWLGSGLLTSTGNRWRKHRKIITPAFHFQILDEFLEVFNSASEVLVSKLKQESKKGTIDIYPFIARCTLDIICETAMGSSVNAQDDLDSEYAKCVNFLMKLLIDRTFSPILGNDLLYPFTKTYRKEKYALKVVHGYARSVIKKRKEEFLANPKSFEASVDSLGRKKKKAFLDLLLEWSIKDPSFTEEDVLQEVDTFLVAGYDTTATSITFALYALAINPEVQKKVYAEMQEIFADDWKRPVTHKDLGQMRYLEMVIKESLRMYTTIPLVAREIEEDVDMNGRILPKGLLVNISIYAMMNSPKWFENPEKFDPERFNAENAKSRPTFSYTPFSAGPRNCIGQKYGMFEMKSTITRILRNFELLPPIPDHKIVLQSEMVLKSANGVYMRLKERE